MYVQHYSTSCTLPSCRTDTDKSVVVRLFQLWRSCIAVHNADNYLYSVPHFFSFPPYFPPFPYHPQSSTSQLHCPPALLHISISSSNPPLRLQLLNFHPYELVHALPRPVIDFSLPLFRPLAVLLLLLLVLIFFSTVILHFSSYSIYVSYFRGLSSTWSLNGPQ